jgi:hypothetical protein
MKKGIVMEIDESFLTLLTPEGEFLHARRQNQPYAIGEEIHFFPIEMVKTSNQLNPLKNIFRMKPVLGLMAAVVIFLGTLIPMHQNNKAYAYMSIDVNPSIELGVNKKMQVVEMTGFNQEGKKIISRMNDWEKEDVSELAITILAEMKKDGFLKTEDHVIISTVRTHELEVKVEKKLQENIEEIKETVNKQKVEVTVLKATEKELDKAHKLGITTGKYQEKEIEESKELTSKEKAKEEQKDNKAVPMIPKDHIPSSQNQSQIDKGLSQKNISIDNKKKTEMNRVDGKVIPPGKLKKIEENQLKQKPELHMEKKSENKITTRNENQKSNDKKKITGKRNENQKSNVKQNHKSKNSDEQKGKNNRNSSKKSKDKHSKKAYDKNHNNPKNK